MAIPNKFFKQLEGTWKNEFPASVPDVSAAKFGWNFISQPMLNDPSPNDFHFSSHRMTETIVFAGLDGIARNIGRTGEAGHWLSMKYEVFIDNADDTLVRDDVEADQAIPRGNPIHHEVGHFLLGVGPDGETASNEKAPVIRQGAIPRANSFMTTGTLHHETAANAADIYDATPIHRSGKLPSHVHDAFQEMRDKVVAADGPNFKEPLAWLSMRLPPPPGDNLDWVFKFHVHGNPAEMAHGQRVVNPVNIGNLNSDFWIGERTIGGQKIEFLQYAQTVDLVFGNIRWPHVAVNTLIKQDLPA